MALNIKSEELEHCQLALTIEVDKERVDNELRKAARKLSREYRIPGFRKGRAPFEVIVQQIGLPNLYGEFMDDLGQELFAEALEQEEIEPYARASLEDINIDPLTYRLIVPLEPEVDLGDYRSVRVEQEPVEIDEEKVTERLESYRSEYAEWADVSRPSQYGDMLNIDVRSVIIQEDDDDAEETVVLDETDWDVTPDEDDPMEPPGFDESLTGMIPDEEKEFVLGWPEDSQSIYAGKEALFKVKLNSIRSYEKPELDDDLAQLVGPDFETLDDLLGNVRETLEEEAESEAENAYLAKALDAVLEQSTLDYPPVVIEDQIDSMVNEFGARLRQYGIEDLETYLQQVGQTLEQYRESLRDQATEVAERNLIISEVLRAERIEVADEDVDAHIETMMGDADSDDESAAGLIEMFRNGAGRPMIETQILQQKAIERIVAIARGEEIPLPTDDSDEEAVAGEKQSDDSEAETPQAEPMLDEANENADSEQDDEDEHAPA